MTPCEKFPLTHDPITGFPIEPDPPRPPPKPESRPGVFTRNAKALINRHKRGGENADR